jgi:glycosyltransferase involved in cell wall biosynthesis
LIEMEGPISFLAVGGGPELEGLRSRVASWGLPRGRFVFSGPQPHARVPELLSLADVGVAPFDVASHAPLAEFGFYWSPLKVFEYMAMALPVVTIDIPPLNEIVRDGREGLLFPTGDVDALVAVLGRLAGDEGLRERLGESARKRVVAKDSPCLTAPSPAASACACSPTSSRHTAEAAVGAPTTWEKPFGSAGTM